MRFVYVEDGLTSEASGLCLLFMVDCPCAHMYAFQTVHDSDTSSHFLLYIVPSSFFLPLSQVKIHYAVHYSRSAQLAAGPAIDGRLLADSDLRDRRYLAAGALNDEPQDNSGGGQV
jgi:hypothetical protein